MKVNLFTSFYKDAVPERYAELLFCLKINSEQPFNEINILTEDAISRDITAEEILKLNVPDEKYCIENIGHRPTFNDFFEIMRLERYADSINVLCNTDIFLNEYFIECVKSFYEKADNKTYTCLALSRWDYLPDQSVEHFNKADSQDVWIFYGSPKIKTAIDFGFGQCGCLSGDMLINYKRAKRSGGRKITINQLYYKFNSIKCKTPNWKIKDLPTYTFSFNIETGIIFYNKILAVVESGLKQTIKLVFNDNSFLVLTKDHLILNEDKLYKQAGELNVGDKVYSLEGTVTKKRLNKRTILFIESGQDIMTYDISMEAPHNNFLANNILVHNCDNRIAHEIKTSGYTILNPSKTIIAYHFHNSNIRNYLDSRGQRIQPTIPPPYHLVTPY